MRRRRPGSLPPAPRFSSRDRPFSARRTGPRQFRRSGALLRRNWH